MHISNLNTVARHFSTFSQSLRRSKFPNSNILRAFSRATWVRWYQEWSLTVPFLDVFCVHGWLPKLSRSHLSPCDCQQACSSHTDDSERTQHCTPRFYAGCHSCHNSANSPGLWTSPQCTGLHGPGLVHNLRQRRRYMFWPVFVCPSVSKITQKRVHGFG